MKRGSDGHGAPPRWFARPIWITAICISGIAANALVYGPALRHTLEARNDFAGIYPGAKLVGTPGIYDAARIRKLQLTATGWHNEQLPFSRLPYYALLLWPLGRLPYRTAYWIWEAGLLAAVLAFGALWSIPSRKATAVACCWSLPLFSSVVIAQDVPILILCIGCAVMLIQRGKHFAAGTILALCAAKFHLFLLLPVWLAAQRRWRTLWGAGLGGAILIGTSFLVAGWHWPSEYVRYLQSTQANPNPAVMPNLHGVFAKVPFGVAAETAAAICVAVLTWVAARHSRLERGLVAALAGGVLIAHHSYLADCAILIPGLLLLMANASNEREQAAAMLLLTPVPYLFIFLGPSTWVTRLILVAFLVSLTWLARHGAAGAAAAQPLSSSSVY